MDLHTITRFRSARDRDDLALRPGEALLGGGTWLFSEPQPQVTSLVDLTTLGWEPVEHLPDGGLRLAATCPISVLGALGPAVFREAADALLMSWKVAEVATVGGNICLGLPAGAMTSLTAGLGGTAIVWTPDRADWSERSVPVVDLVIGDGRTALAPDEVLRAVDLPPGWDSPTDVAWRRTSLVVGGRSAAVVVGRRTPAGPVCTVTASTPRPVVLGPDDDVERAVSGPGGPGWFDDAHGAPDWRAAMTARLVAEVREELS